MNTIEIINLTKIFSAMILLSLQLGPAYTQIAFKKSSIEIEYYVNVRKGYSIDSSRVNIILKIPNEDKSIDYKFNFSEIWEVDFIDQYCEYENSCLIEEVIAKLNHQGKCAIIIEFPDGYFTFLSEICGALTHYSNSGIAENYAIFHKDKRHTFLRQEVYSRCSKEIFSKSFRLYIMLLEYEKGKETSVNFVTDWLEMDKVLIK